MLRDSAFKDEEVILTYGQIDELFKSWEQNRFKGPDGVENNCGGAGWAGASDFADFLREKLFNVEFSQTPYASLPIE